MNPLPVGFIKVETGHSSGPPLSVRTAPVERGKSLTEIDKTKDVVVVKLRDYEKIAAEQMTGEENVMRPLAFKVGDARKLAIQLLFGLASCGDEVSKKLLEKVPEARQELEQ